MSNQYEYTVQARDHARDYIWRAYVKGYSSFAVGFTNTKYWAHRAAKKAIRKHYRKSLKAVDTEELFDYDPAIKQSLHF